VVVALCLERVTASARGLPLGLLKEACLLVAGPSHPTDWLSFMLEDSAVWLVLTSEAELDHLPAHSAPAFCVWTVTGRR